MTAGYGTSAIKRDRLTKRQLKALDESILDYTGEQNPITVRGVFYAMSTRGMVPKNDAGYRRIQRRVLELRRSGVLPYNYISDSTRWIRRPEVHSGLLQMLEDAQRFYRRDIWDAMPVHVEVWCEKDALAGVLSRATAPWHVPLMVSRGFSSDSYLFETAEYLVAQEKPAFVYLFTDFDAAGIDIDEKIRSGLQRFGAGAEIHFQRGALSLDQVHSMGLPTREPKPRDIQRGFDRCAELDAIPPKTLIAMVEELVLQHVDAGRLTELRTVEQAERETLGEIVNSLGGAA